MDALEPGPQLHRCVFFNIRLRRVEAARAHTSRWRGSAAATLLDLDMSRATSRPASLFGEHVFFLWGQGNLAA